MAIYPDWAVKHRLPGTELRLIRGKFYLYEVSSVYDKKKKRARKISGKYLGAISEEKGFVPSEKQQLREKAARVIDLSKISVREFGFTAFLRQFNISIAEALEKSFPGLSLQIIYMAYSRLLYNSPIKNIPFHIAKSMLTAEDISSYSEKYFSGLLRKIGANRQGIAGYMKSFISPNDFVLVDMTNIVTDSRQMRYAKEGYNSNMVFHKQFNLLYIYSSSLLQPVFYRLYAGNLREVTGFKICLQESGLDDAVVIADKGFYSEANIQAMNQENLRYIIPLKRDNRLIDYRFTKSNTLAYFKFEGRYIWHGKLTTEQNRQVFFFLDEQLKVQEKRDYLDRVETLPEYYSIETFHQKEDRFGTIALLTNLPGAEAEQIYTTYKSRNNVEVMFDGIKNVLHADRTYMQNEDALEGWMFINHIALQWYYIIYNLLLLHKQLKRFSVRDFLIHLTEIKKVRIDDRWVLEPTIKSTEALLYKLNIHIT